MSKKLQFFCIKLQFYLNTPVASCTLGGNNRWKILLPGIQHLFLLDNNKTAAIPSTPIYYLFVADRLPHYWLMNFGWYMNAPHEFTLVNISLFVIFFQRIALHVAQHSTTLPCWGKIYFPSNSIFPSIKTDFAGKVLKIFPPIFQTIWFTMLSKILENFQEKCTWLSSKI